MFPPVALGVIMATLDASVVNIALPTLGRAFQVPLPTLEWVVLGYALTLTGLMLAAGRLADARGRRRTYAEGLAVFTIASALCAVAPSVTWLVAARVLQGVGAAMVSGNGSALLVAAFPASERGRVLGAFGAMVGVGLALGPVLGGLIVAGASWRWIFAINLPLGLLAAWWLRRSVPRDAPAAGARGPDALSVLLSCAALASLLLALGHAPVSGWASRAVLVAALAAIGLGALFVVRQRRLPEPLLPPGLLRGTLGAALTLTLVAQAIGAAVGLQLPLHLEQVHGWDAARTGRWFGVLPLSALLVAPVAGRLSDRIGPTRLTTSGLALVAMGLWLLGDLGMIAASGRLAVALVAIGAGQGLFAVPNTSLVLSRAPRGSLGLAAGLQGTARNVGLSCGVALMTVLVAAGAPAGGAWTSPTANERAALADATQLAFRCWAGVAALAAIAAWRLGARQDPA